jgi:hypothetical protein
MIILLKKAQTHHKSNVGKHPMHRFYKKHKSASKSFIFIEETQLDIFFESVREIQLFRKSRCDCWCLHFDTISHIYP